MVKLCCAWQIYRLLHRVCGLIVRQRCSSASVSSNSPSNYRNSFVFPAEHIALATRSHHLTFFELPSSFVTKESLVLPVVARATAVHLTHFCLTSTNIFLQAQSQVWHHNNGCYRLSRSQAWPATPLHLRRSHRRQKHHQALL